ncbi:tumor necrosis factor receptor superfamily member 10D-like [Bubalus kerabau]|uniref:tumor necrosis factor receptor superfamily member 10D-like n=1 Tax=Bubalus carabanensis TaxID=3119969 RepID=UPI00244E7147|nr:tumor necrosis factor receptor superfamily member 10D-like [Bubalus carabanensis]XP_055435749.1 tumor necrosis factor receptor superfamily member 10D-like [Bubalus carabanensis]
MTVPAINLRGPRQRTLPDRKRQRGRKAPASSSAGAGRPGGPKLRFGYLVFVMGVVLWVKPASAMSVRKDEIHQQSSAPLERSPQQNLCPPGFYMEEAIGGCAPCTDGIDYTSHSNTLPSCLPCTTCKSAGITRWDITQGFLSIHSISDYTSPQPTSCSSFVI